MWIDQQWRHLLFIERPDALRARPTRYGCPVLFPFPGYVRNARYHWCDSTRTLPINGPDGRSHVHGFAHDRPWRVVDTGDGSVTLELATSRDLTIAEQNAYPFDIVLRQGVTLSNRVLTIALEATNKGSDVAPVGLGLHPYVDPSILNSPRLDLVAGLPGASRRILDGSVPTGELQAVPSNAWTLRGLEEPVICLTDLGDDASALLHGADGRIVHCALDAGWTDIVLYAPPDQPSVALEPLTCALSAASMNPASPYSIPSLEPNRSVSAVMRLRLMT
jgi:aldose 1-epimerase